MIATAKVKAFLTSAVVEKAQMTYSKSIVNTMVMMILIKQSELTLTVRVLLYFVTFCTKHYNVLKYKFKLFHVE